MWKVLILALPLSGCLTYEDRVAIDAVAAEERSRTNAVNAEIACKAMARNLVQVARCEVRR